MSEPASLQIVSLYCTVRPSRIVFLKHILEGYDGLALLSTISAQVGLVRLQTPSANYAELMELLESLAPELSPCTQIAQAAQTP